MSEPLSPRPPLPQAGEGEVSARLVLLGASNLARCLPTAVATARAVAHGNHPEHPAWIGVAGGRGRSYGQGSVLLGRSLPGILESGLWPALDAAPAGPTYALLTDIGNDVAYGVDPDTILRWIETVLDRLQKSGEGNVQLSVTALPLENLDRFPLAFLEVFRKALFPSSTLPMPELLDRAEILDRHLRELCAERDLPVIDQPETWFGLDPIHYRLRLRHQVWHRILDPWRRPDIAPPDRATSKLFLWRAWPESSSVLGRSIHRPQPCTKLRDGTPISLF